MLVGIPTLGLSTLKALSLEFGQLQGDKEEGEAVGSGETWG